MSEKAGRRFWRIHLSTAVLLMFVAGLCLWANIGYRNFGETSDFNPWRPKGWPVGGPIRLYAQGWPLPYSINSWSSEERSVDSRKISIECTLLAIPADFLAAIGIVGGTAIALEYLIRRREGRKA